MTLTELVEALKEVKTTITKDWSVVHSNQFAYGSPVLGVLIHPDKKEIILE